MKRLLVLLPLIVSCEFFVLTSAYPEIDVTFNTVKEAWTWVSWNVVYEQDPQNIWQFPQTTYWRKRGDCEDMAMLFAYFLEEMGIDAEIIIYDAGDYNHAIVRANNIYYEPSAYGVVRPAYKITPHILQIIPYSEGLKICQE